MTDKALTILVTGGAGFIGSALVRRLVRETRHLIVNVDKLTYAGNLESLGPVSDAPNYRFEQIDIGDRGAIERVFTRHDPDAVMHLAAESHVDRSIDGPSPFIETNIVGTYSLLEAAREHCVRRYGAALDAAARPIEVGGFRFLHVSTDEVFGALGAEGCFGPESAYRPNSPYAASKAAADHLARAWHKTFDLPVVTTNCTNNYGPHQFPEKLIPLCILCALDGKPIPVYGDGLQVRDWLYVDDHTAALWQVLRRGLAGRVYCIGGGAERTNLAVVEAICDFVDELAPRKGRAARRSLIEFVDDRPGHDRRYAMETETIATELGWRPEESFETGLRKTVQWYLDNLAWCRHVQDGSYRGERLGLARRAGGGR